MNGLPLFTQKKTTKKEQFEEQIRKKWENAPIEKLDPLRSSWGKLRLQRTLEFLERQTTFKEVSIADLGCGTGALAAQLAQKGAHVTAIDVTNRALNLCPQANITKERGCLPYLKLPDHSFEGLILADVIAEIDPHLYRLSFSELSRLMTKEGWLLCSSELDIYSMDADKSLISLVQTEFDIVAQQKSYHRLYFYLRRLIDAPARFVRASRDKDYRLKQLQKRSGLGRLWFYLNSIFLFSYFWKPVAFLLSPIKKRVYGNERVLLIAERLSQILFGEGALTHLIIFARKKKL